MINNLSDSKKMKEFFGFRPILSSSIKVTRNCNLHCKHCYVHTNNGEENIPLSDIKKIIDDLSNAGCMNLFINGGEPFLRDDIVEIFNYAMNKGLLISVSSNGQVINEKILSEIKSKNLKLFQVSVDGTEQIHNNIRRADSYKNAIRALKLASKILDKNTQIVMATTIMKDNIEHIPEMLKLAKECKVDTYCLVPLMSSSDDKYVQAEDITAKEKKELFDKVVDIYEKKYQNDFELSLVVPPALIPKELKNRKFGHGYVCTFPEMLGIDANQNVAPCDGLLDNQNFLLGNIKEKNINNITDNEIMKELENIEWGDLTGVCSICKYTNTCQGGCRVSSFNKFGNFICPDSICQEMYEEGLFPYDSIDITKEYKPLKKENNKC